MTNRNYLVRDQAARTVFVALYIGAVEGEGIWLAPKHVYRMSDEQMKAAADTERQAYELSVMKPGGRAPGQQWYADTSREPIRDETLREAFVVVGAAIERPGVATTSNRGRYALQRAFAALFDPALEGAALDEAIEAWQNTYLTAGAVARIAIVRSGAAASGEYVPVTFPSGETRRMKPGPSSDITKAVVEVFAPRFLKDPAVLFLSESGNKVVARDEKLAKAIGLNIKADKDLPDTILVDLGPAHPLLVFVEVVATDGPINERRKASLIALAVAAGFSADHLVFVTAFLDRSQAAFRKTMPSLAWGTYAWFASEPGHLVFLADDGPREYARLIGPT
jgi:hypothetical protein